MFLVYPKGIEAAVRNDASVSEIISDAKRISNDHYGLPVKFSLHGVDMVIDHSTSEASAYWNYMRHLDESVT